MDLQEQGARLALFLRAVFSINGFLMGFFCFHPGMFSAAASLGVSLLWDTDVGLSQIDKYAYATEDHIKVRCSVLVRVPR